MSKELTSTVVPGGRLAVLAVAAFALNGCLGGGMVVDASEPPDTETDTDPTEATPFSGFDPAGPLSVDRTEQIAAAKSVPVREAAFER